MKDLGAIRAEIDALDAELTSLLCRRMQIVREVAAYKQANGLPVADRSRESAVLARVSDRAGDSLAPYLRAVYSAIFDVSRAWQHTLGSASPLEARLEKELPLTRRMPEKAVVACWGGHTRRACGMFVQRPTIVQCASFSEVFSSVREGLCAFGVVPEEEDVLEQLCAQGLSIVGSAAAEVPGRAAMRCLCVAKTMAAYEGANRIAVRLGADRTPGWLYHLFSGFAALGMGVTGLKTSPSPDGVHAFLLYLELAASLESLSVRRLVGSLSKENAHFALLGVYRAL